MIAKSFASGVSDLAKGLAKTGRGGRGAKPDNPPSYAQSQADYFKKKMGNYKVMGNQMAFEMATAASEFLAAGKNPT